jgi:hypothetical protein
VSPLLAGLLIVGSDRGIDSAFRTHIDCDYSNPSRLRAHHGRGKPFTVRSIQKDKIGPEATKLSISEASAHFAAGLNGVRALGRKLRLGALYFALLIEAGALKVAPASPSVLTTP